ncbi:SDR family oxidoreductase [Bengtsoniella intestinalis]|uniref:SDR family NAD(P)-dependent oxidoreductase n=1 Tax=Bengtsoniella intestinalis TaxID=3073143 RepID=UPI00391F6C50
MKTMLLTGTTQGIGAAMYHRFKDQYHVVTINRREAEGDNILCDLADVEQVERVCKRLGGMEIDILINNAGGALPSPFPDLDIGALQTCTNLNYHGPVLLMQAVLAGMKDRGYGRIVNISSIASKSPRPLIPHYGASKAALECFSKSMAVAYGGANITINNVCPGGVATATSLGNRRTIARLSGKEENTFNRSMAENNGLNRMVREEEIVDAVAFFISPQADAISGQTLNICGTTEVH